MTQKRLSKLELQIMEAVLGPWRPTVREVQERFPQKTRPAYTTVQTMVNRLEAKGALGRARKTGQRPYFPGRPCRATLPSAAWWTNSLPCSAAGCSP